MVRVEPNEVARLLQDVARRWPHCDVAPDAGDAWMVDVAELAEAEVRAAIRSWARSGRAEARFAPTSGWVAGECARRRAAPAPSFDELQRWLSRHCWLLPHEDVGGGDLADTVAALEAAGAHEAVLRFVVAHGVFGVRRMPDPSVQALDVGQLADRRDRAREYRDRVLVDWREDPRPGVALERARAARELERGAAARGLRRPSLALVPRVVPS